MRLLDLTVQRASRLPGIPSDALLRRWVRAALAARSVTAHSPHDSATLTLRIVNAAEARNLNSAFRGKDYATNVLTFIYHEPKAVVLMGDIVLCAQVLAREAREQGKLLRDHYTHMVVHGVLHLRGFDHERPRDATKMEALEIAVLHELGVGNPYATDEQ